MIRLLFPAIVADQRSRGSGSENVLSIFLALHRPHRPPPLPVAACTAGHHIATVRSWRPATTLPLRAQHALPQQASWQMLCSTYHILLTARFDAVP